MKKRLLLTQLRKERKWSQKDVVEKIHLHSGMLISVSYYGMIEQGVRTPKLELALAIASLFARKPDEIFFGQENNNVLGNKTTA